MDLVGQKRAGASHANAETASYVKQQSQTRLAILGDDSEPLPRVSIAVPFFG